MTLQLMRTLALISVIFWVQACSDADLVKEQSSKTKIVETQLTTDKVDAADMKTQSFVIVNSKHVQPIYIDTQVDPLIEWAVLELVSDIAKITGKQLPVIKANKKIEKGIYIGQVSDLLIENSTLLNEQLSVELTGQWESFNITAKGEQLAIVGSDVRGTVYAIFDIAERLGISPWQWWADVAVLPQDHLTINLPLESVVQSPSVQYRGIFLNDEDWGLQPWAAKTFEPDVNDIGPKTYEKIFQLLLRLKANTIWPAMHPSTKAFYQIMGNQAMAQQYHIVVGTSHAEPMLRNNVDEWDKQILGQYNYIKNSETINEYWQQRVNQVKDARNKNMFTIGMRGVHDSHMEGVKSTAEGVNLLHSIFNTQREMLASTLNKPANTIAQVFIPYKEVLELYNNGLQVPEDVTLMWTDDNYGYIRRLSDENEQQRKGRSGVYYHLSYWGRPHDYLWLSTTQPALIWYEMSKAYANGADKIWIANVGDIKPSEYTMELFLDLAWDVNAITPETIKTHLIQWAAREFNPEIANEVSVVMNEYYRLAFIRKPEFMGWSQTEPTTQTQLTEFTTEEAKRRINAYTALVKQVDLLKHKVPTERFSAWFQLVEYPVKSAASMNDKYLYRQLASECSEQKCQQQYQTLALNAHQQISQLTETYNTQISNGKWQYMMSMKPRNLPVYQEPTFEMKAPDKKLNGNKTKKATYIQASQFSANSAFDKYQWQRIDSLGYSNQAVTLWPFKQHTFEQNKPWLEYEIEVFEAGDYLIEVRSLPTHANTFDDEITVYLDDVNIGKAQLNTKGRSQAWKTNVLRNSQIKTFPVAITEIGKHKLKIAVNQTGIVLDQLAVYLQNDKSAYEIPYSDVF